MILDENESSLMKNAYFLNLKTVYNDAIVADVLMIAPQPDADGTPVPFLEDPVAVMDVIVANDGVFSIAFDADAAIEEFVVMHDAVVCRLFDIHRAQFPHGCKTDSAGEFRNRVMEIQILHVNETSLQPDAVSELPGLRIEFGVGE